jgi:hypothetical protein
MEMTMILLLLPAVTAVTAWLLDLATWLVARALNMPQPFVLTTGLFVFAQIQAVESNLGRLLCSRRLMRQLRALWRSLRCPFTPAERKGDLS